VTRRLKNLSDWRAAQACNPHLWLVVRSIRPMMGWQMPRHSNSCHNQARLRSRGTQRPRLQRPRTVALQCPPPLRPYSMTQRDGVWEGFVRGYLPDAVPPKGFWSADSSKSKSRHASACGTPCLHAYAWLAQSTHRNQDAPLHFMPAARQKMSELQTTHGLWGMSADAVAAVAQQEQRIISEHPFEYEVRRNASQ
jgi:hypothetical protein